MLSAQIYLLLGLMMVKFAFGTY